MKRRNFIKASVLGFALPSLEIFADKPIKSPSVSRMLCLGNWLGFYTPEFFPKSTGKDYKSSRLLMPVDEFRNDYTIFSGLDHRCSHGHKSWNNFLCGTDSQTISLDQKIAEVRGQETRFKTIQLTCGRKPAEAAMNVTKDGIVLPLINRPSVLFNKLFSPPQDIARRKYEAESGKSVLDNIRGSLKEFSKKVGKRDNEKLDEYFTAVRGVEKNIYKRRLWLDKPVHTTDYKMPKRDPMAAELLFDCEKIMFDLSVLAFEIGATNIISYIGSGDQNVFRVDGELLTASYHGLSHHGNRPKTVEEYVRVNEMQMNNVAALLKQLKEKKDVHGRSLLDSTIVYLSSGLGNSNTHSTSNVPVLLAGGGFKHGSHHAIDASSDNAPVLGQLFVSMMQKMGMNEKAFANAKGDMNSYLL